jgi:thymidylate synthase
MNEQLLLDYAYKPLRKKLDAGEIVGNTVELLGFQLRGFDPQQPLLNFTDVNGDCIRKSPKKYIQHERDWYESQDLSINGHEGIQENPIWTNVCSKEPNREINSNYGWCVFSKANGYQYFYAKKQLLNDPNTRQASIIYNRPSIQWEWDQGGKHDFMCTWNTRQFIRNNKFYYIVNMRSQDSINGFYSDYPHHCDVYMKMYNEIKAEKYHDLEIAEIIWNADSFHIYDRHFDMLRKLTDATYSWQT